MYVFPLLEVSEENDLAHAYFFKKRSFTVLESASQSRGWVFDPRVNHRSGSWAQMFTSHTHPTRSKFQASAYRQLLSHQNQIIKKKFKFYNVFFHRAGSPNYGPRSHFICP